MPFTKSRRARVVFGSSMGLCLLVLGASVYAFKDGFLEEWYLWKLDGKDPVSKTRAAQWLGAKGSARILPRLLAKCIEKKRKSPDKKPPIAGSPGGVRGFAPFESEPWYIEVAVWNIIYRERSTALPVLVRLLRRDDADERFFAAQALGLIGTTPRAVVTGLTEALKDGDEGVRRAAAAALEKVEQD